MLGAEGIVLSEKETKMKINEIFGPTVQGEGKNEGKPVTFLRLSGCNLHCVWCDTPFTWNWVGTSFDHTEKYDRTIEEKEMSHEDVLQLLKKNGGDKTKSLVISGGEPLIQQKDLEKILLQTKDFGWYAEVETNGTIPLRPLFAELIDQVNCSPKLANAGDRKSLRVREKTLRDLAKNVKVNFKFVVSDEGDVPEILEIASILKEERSDVEIRLMPLCRTPEELRMREPLIQSLSEEYGFIPCSRLSILAGNKRGE